MLDPFHRPLNMQSNPDSNGSAAASSHPYAPRLRELNQLANDNPEEFIRIFDQGRQRLDTPSSTPTQDPQVSQLIAALQNITATPRPPPAARKKHLRVTPFDGNPEILYRFLSELSSKLTLEGWTTETEKVIIAESLLAKGERADRLMESYRILGQTTITTLEDWKQCLRDLCEDTGAQDRANRRLLDSHFDKIQHQSYAEYFAEFCVIASKTSHSEAMKYDILERGTPAWLRRLARPLPLTAQSPNWRQL